MAYDQDMISSSLPVCIPLASYSRKREGRGKRDRCSWRWQHIRTSLQASIRMDLFIYFLHESSDSSINRKSKAEVLGYRAPCPPRVSDTRPYSSPFIGFFSLLKSYSGFFFYIQLDFIFLFFHESVMRLWNNVEFYFLLTITFVWRKKSWISAVNCLYNAVGNWSGRMCEGEFAWPLYSDPSGKRYVLVNSVLS